MKRGELRLGEIYRDARPKDETIAVIDGLPNIYYHTAGDGQKMVPLESGINPIREAGTRRPAILITSSPHKIGSQQTPWQDYFNTDVGHVRYYGDNKDPSMNPGLAVGNRNLLAQFDLHKGADETTRLRAAPILLFQRVGVGGRQKGNLRFHGLAIIDRVELVSQYDRSMTRTFTNFAYDFVVLNLHAENDVFPWKWINMRRNSSLTDTDALVAAPQSWRKWVSEGEVVLESLRHRVAKLNLESKADQTPSSRELDVLREVYDFYSGKKHRFEALAAKVTERVIESSGSNYQFGWITPQGGDFGVDFVGKLEIGRNFGSAKLILLGQAKCEKLDVPTGGNHIARTVQHRLRRGWIGVYVTTSFFSERVQREVREDRFPILLINGKSVAEEVLKMHHEQGSRSIRDLLEQLDSLYDSLVSQRSPEELLLD